MDILYAYAKQKSIELKQTAEGVDELLREFVKKKGPFNLFEKRLIICNSTALRLKFNVIV